MADQPVNAVIDLSHYNAQVDFDQAAQAGLIGVIHKATEGLAYVDPTYAARRPQAEGAGLLWGAYHFGTDADGVAQADHFLSTVGPANGAMLLALDFEANAAGGSMTLAQAQAFVTHVQTRTGRWPGLYSGAYVKSLLGGKPDPVLGQCWFWLAEYGPTPVVPPAWKTWTLWQYTDGSTGDPPYAWPGVGTCDRDQYNGDAAQLTQFWKAGGV